MPHPSPRVRFVTLALAAGLGLPGARAADVAPPAAAAASAPAAARSTAAGHGFTLADGFTLREEGALRVATAPEGDTTITIADVDATSADDAVAKGWALVQPGFKRALRLATPRPPRYGWEEQRFFEYETSPNEKRVVQALVRRAGKSWVAVLMDGSEATFEKRGSPIGKMITSLRPKGYQRESFAGRTPHALDAARIATLKAFVEDGMKQLDVPGVAISLISSNRVVFEGGFGVRRLGRSEPVDAHTLFMAASNTKAMTTTLLASAVDRGLLRWDQRANEAYAGFRLGDAEVTNQVLIKHLVCACTGLPRQDLEWLFTDGRAPAAGTFAQLAVMKPTSRFGEVFQYSNLMVGAAGFIAGAALHPRMEVGAAYDRAMRERVFGPLGMHRTTFDFARAQKGNHASPHGDDLDGRTRLARMDLNHTIVPARPAGAVWTSAHDFSRYVLLELLRGRTPEGRTLVSEAAMQARYEPQIMVGEDVSYGMGLFIDRQLGVTVVRHGGDMLGFHSDMFWLPEHGVGGTILTNSDAGVLLRGPFLRKLLEVLFDGQPEADTRLRVAAENRRTEVAKARQQLTHPVPADVAATLAERYASPVLGPLRVQRQGGRLRFAFRHWDSEVALRRNGDGSRSFVTIDPGEGGFEFVLDDQVPGTALVLRDSQHEYRFDAAPLRRRGAKVGT